MDIVHCKFLIKVNVKSAGKYCLTGQCKFYDVYCLVDILIFLLSSSMVILRQVAPAVAPVKKYILPF